MAMVPQHQPPKMPNLRVPHVDFATQCGALGRVYSCNRPEGHGGRHCYSWRNARGILQGKVRGVWI